MKERERDILKMAANFFLIMLIKPITEKGKGERESKRASESER